MAVIQISRIQIRRGKKNEGTGFPQLASGELGWAIDTQELYIGNGSVAEGAPAVGNTKILTEKDLFVDNTMLSLVHHIYRYPEIRTGDSINSPVSRSLQQCLDDRVTAADFGADGNYNIVTLEGLDSTIPLQRAIDQLFLNESNTEAYNNTVDGVKSRVILEIPAGRFKLSSTLYIPSYATIVGAGADKTIIEYVGTSGPAIKFVNDSSTPGNPNPDATLGVTQPKDIILKGLTIHTLVEGITVLSLESVKNSVFEDLNINGFSLNIDNVNSKGISMSVESDIVTCEKNQFNRVNITGFTYGLYAREDIINNTFANVFISNAKIGVAFGDGLVQDQIGQKYGPRNNQLTDFRFANIIESAIIIKNGFGNVVNNVTLENVGNMLSGFESITYPQIYIQSQNNIVTNVVSDRSSLLGDPLYRVKIVRMDLNRSVTASAGSYIVQLDGAITVAEGFLRNDVATSTEIEIIVADDNQIFDTTNNLTIEDDATPSDSNLAVHPTIVDDISERNIYVPYIPEVAGRAEYQSQGTRRIHVSPVNLFVYSDLIKLPVNTDLAGVPNGSISYDVNYVYTSDNGFIRKGKFNIICNVETKYVLLTDEYDYLDTSITSSDTDEAVKLEFRAKLVDEVGDVVTGATTPYSIIVTYTNSLTADEGYLIYSYSSLFVI